MKVEEFWIGIPPRAKTLFQDKKWTIFTLNWLPIGGFVRIKWEDTQSAEASDSDAFAAKKWWARALVLIAWVTMNFLLAWVIFTGLFWQWFGPLAVNFLLEKNYNSYFLPSFQESLDSGFLYHEGILIDPLAWGVAWKQGIAKGDILESVDREPVTSIEALIKKIQTNTPMEFTLIRASDKKSYTIPIAPQDGKIQAYLRYANLDIKKDMSQSFWFFTSVKKWLDETIILSRVTLDFLGKILSDLIAPKAPEDREIAKEMVAWPIGMWAGMIELIKIGVDIDTLLIMIAMLSINLWVINILPFPALDGGRLVSTTILSIASLFTTKKKHLQKFEQVFHSIWMLFLIVLSIFIAIFDILKL